jgi:hypothetical protein
MHGRHGVHAGRNLTIGPAFPHMNHEVIWEKVMNSDLRPVHVDAPLDPGGKGKLIAGLVVVLAILGIGGYTYSQGDWHFHSTIAVSDSQLPQASLPHNMPNGG